MKKLIIFAVAILMGVSAQAQIVGSRSTSISREVVPSNTTWYYRLGLAFDGVSGDVKDTKTAFGYDTAIGFKKSINSLQGLWWGMEFGLASRGWKAETSYEDVDLTWRSHGIQISPVNVGYSFEVADGIAIDPHIGLFASYDLFGNYSVSDDDYDYDEDWDEGVQKFDAGFNIGVGLWINKQINVDLRYRKGMVNMADDGDDYKVNSSKFIVSVGIAF